MKMYLTINIYTCTRRTYHELLDERSDVWLQSQSMATRSLFEDSRNSLSTIGIWATIGIIAKEKAP